MRLVHQLSLLLIVTVLAAVTAVSGLVAWNLRAGFSDYLRTQDGDQLTRLMQVAEQDLARMGGPPRDWRRAMHRWLRDARPDAGAADEGEGELPPLPAAPPPLREGDERRGPPEGEPRRGPPDGPLRRADPASFGPRLNVLAADGTTLLAGRPDNLSHPGQLRAIKLQGQTLAHLRLTERAGPAMGVDASFLRRQYLGLAGVGLGVVLLALLMARLAAVRWARPLREAQAAARRVAAGDFAHRLPAEAAARGATEMVELHHDINAMAASLERFESSRQRWIAELSHELRTPLAVLRGEVEALLDGIRPLDRAALESLQEEVKRLARLIEDFHVLALSELRALPCEFAAVAPAALLQAAVLRVKGRAAVLGLEVLAEIPEVLPAAQWDAGRITQLLANLLENSLRYTRAPGQVRLRVDRALEGLQIRLDDSPPGVPPADLERLFDPLYRADPSRSRESGGSGLGLAIARAIAEGHGGTLRAEASPLGGLSMILTLPLNPTR